METIVSIADLQYFGKYMRNTTFVRSVLINIETLQLFKLIIKIELLRYNENIFIPSWYCLWQV